jgi:outer membrane protein assembly factor BamB
VSRRTLLIAALLVVLLAAGSAGTFVLIRLHESRNIHGSSTVQFVPTAVPRPPARAQIREGIVWPTYGYDQARLRNDSGSKLAPPFRQQWLWHGQALLEFPPVIGFGRLYLTTFDGRFFALDAKTGKAIFRWDSGRCGWASPAVDGNLVFATFIGKRATCNASVPGTDGELVAFAAHGKRARIRWTLRVGPTESSPLVVDGLVYIGDWLGEVYAVDGRTGKVRWRFHTGGKIKGSVAEAGGIVYIGAYDGHVYALNARTGRELWRASEQARLGSSGTFYATPAVAFGRVYIGSTDGKEYSFGARSGDLLWSHGTGSYIYASAAIWHRLVLVGSYDQNFYAFDAATGDVRWQFRANGPISGSATVLGNIVYFSTFARRTYALDAATGRLVWSFPDGKYSPVVADAQRVYLTGYGKLYGLDPMRRRKSGFTARPGSARRSRPSGRAPRAGG